MIILQVLGYFLAWTFCLYWIHRIVHKVPIIKQIHNDHHAYIATNPPPVWHWNNFFLFNDTWLSTLDLWITEVIPTVVFAWATGQWWIAAFYYVWAALIQERIEHNPQFDLYPSLPGGRWHLLHHTNCKANFGPFVITWDLIFGTHKND